MKIYCESIGDVPVVRITGEVDMSKTQEIDDAVGQTVTNQAHALIIDLSEVTYLDSAGVRLLYQLDARLAVHQQRLIVIVPSGAMILRTLQAAGVIGSLVLASTEEAAFVIARAAAQQEGNGTDGPSG